MKTFITGATGIVGCEIVREFLRHDGGGSIVVLMRGTPAEIDLKRRWLLQWADVAEVEEDRLEVVCGDMTAPGLGLSSTDRDRLASVTGILHAAAVTRFDQSAGDALRNNVTSTSNVIDVARSCPRVDRIGIISTAHVAGRRCGTIRTSPASTAAACRWPSSIRAWIKHIPCSRRTSSPARIW